MNTATASRTSTTINFHASASADSSVSAANVGIALLRVALGAMFLAHGLLKLIVFTLPGTAGFQIVLLASETCPHWKTSLMKAISTAGFKIRFMMRKRGMRI